MVVTGGNVVVAPGEIVVEEPGSTVEVVVAIVDHSVVGKHRGDGYRQHARGEEDIGIGEGHEIATVCPAGIDLIARIGLSGSAIASLSVSHFTLIGEVYVRGGYLHPAPECRFECHTQSVVANSRTGNPIKWPL